MVQMVCTLLVALAQGPTTTRDVRIRDLASPAGSGSGEASLFVAGDRVYLSWIESGQAEGQGTFFFSLLEGDTWSPPKEIYRGDSLFINWADFPKLAVTAAITMATWLEKLAGGTYAYGVRYACSFDGGSTWTPPRWLHEDRSQSEHGFVSLIPLNDGGIGALWLDGRAMANGGAMQLRYRAVTPAGVPGPEMVVDEATCECCNTDMALTGKGPVAVYRDKTPAHIRDIHLARLQDGQWRPSQALHDDGWMIQGCPVNGPALHVVGDTAAVAWFTAASGTAVRLVFSRDGGHHFGVPVTVSENALGRVDVQLFPGGKAAVSWIESSGTSATLMVALYDHRAKPLGEPLAIDRVPAERASGVPRLAGSGNRLVIAYRDPDAALIKLKLLEFYPN